MSGNSSGVAKRVNDIESRAVFVHCMTHSLNLAVQDATRVVKHAVAKPITLLRDILDLTREVINFIKASPKRCRMVQDLQSKEHFHASLEEKPSGLRPLCPTRFTVRYQSLQSLDKNFELLDSALDEISSEMTDETGSKVRGFQRQLRTFDTLFALEVAMLLFQLTDDCSKLTQKVDASALDSQHAMQNVAGMIRNLRSDDHFEHHYQTALAKATKRDIDPPGSRDLLLKFLDSLHISGTVGARNIKFGVQIHHEKHLRKK